MSTKLLVPLDGSELAEAALPYAIEIAKALGWSVLLLRVVEGDPGRRPPTEPLVEGSVAHYQTEPRAEQVESQRLQELEAAAYASLAATAERVQAAGVACEREVGTGRPRDVISGRAMEGDVAAVVMASHGRTGLARIFRGSVAAGVIEDAPRPTLVVRPFRDEHARVDLEHAERLAPAQADALRQAVDRLSKA